MERLLMSLNDVTGVISLSDIIFLLLILILIILIITMFYVFKLGQEFVYVDRQTNDNKKSNENNNTNKVSEEEPPLEDLASISKAIEENNVENNINLSRYEKEQEDSAIISYDQLLRHNEKKNINYKNEEVFDGIKIRQIDLEPFNKVENNKDLQIKVISYVEEEAFLEALKNLKENLI